MLLIGGYTHYPVGIPAKAGEGVALFREVSDSFSAKNPPEPSEAKKEGFSAGIIFSTVLFSF